MISLTTIGAIFGIFVLGYLFGFAAGQFHGKVEVLEGDWDDDE